MTTAPHNSASSNGPRPGDELAADLRVILVGRSGLDAALRRDGRVEISRCKTALEAVGELADPIDGMSPTAAAVVVGAGGEPDGSAEEFVSALRMIDPHAPVLLERPGTTGSPAAPYDATVRGEASPAELRDVVARVSLARSGWVAGTPVAATGPEVQAAAARGRQAGQQEQRAQQPTQQQQQAEQPPPSQQQTGAVAGVPPINVASDYRVLQAVLAGRDPLFPAVELIRARTGSADVAFIPANDAGGQAMAAPVGGAPVAIRGRPLGWLRSNAVSPVHLQAHAEWLGAWLALLEQQAMLRHAAMVDEMTGAYNRRSFDRFLASAIEHAQQNRQTITLMVFDIDDFKSFNDRYGHPAGDQILRETVRLLRSVIRPNDRVCRIGGDEFAVIFYDAAGPRDPGSKPPENVSGIAARFQQQIREHRFPKLGDLAPGSLTVSGGISTYPWDGRNVDELLEHADKLALEAKRAGKNAIAMGPGSEAR